MGDVLSKSSARFTRDNCNYREQTSLSTNAWVNASKLHWNEVPAQTWARSEPPSGSRQLGLPEVLTINAP